MQGLLLRYTPVRVLVPVQDGSLLSAICHDPMMLHSQNNQLRNAKPFFYASSVCNTGQTGTGCAGAGKPHIRARTVIRIDFYYLSGIHAGNVLSL